MAQAVKDFWPADIGASDLRAPVTLLREQAALLGPKTKNVVTAEVTSTAVEDGNIVDTFWIEAPQLGGYRYGLFQLRHTAMPYPVSVEWEDQPFLAKDEAELETAVKRILASDETKRVVKSLLAQSQSDPPRARARPGKIDATYTM